MPDLISWILTISAWIAVGTAVGYLQHHVSERRKRARRPSVEIVEVSLSPGAPFEKWCDDCNRTHLWVTLYAYEGDDPTTARPIGTAPLADDYEEDSDA